MHSHRGMKLAALWLALCLPVAARAARFTVEVPAALDLATGERQLSELADVRLTTGGIESAYGIRLDRPRSRPEVRAPLVIGARYLIEGRDRIQYRLIVHSVLGRRVAVEILKPGESPSGPRVLRLGGGYRLERFTIDRAPAATSYPDLELGADGTYRLGGGKGRWQSDGWILSLDGYYGRWGPADVSADARALTFRFFRGSRLFEVTFVRVEDPPPEKLAAREPPKG